MNSNQQKNILACDPGVNGAFAWKSNTMGVTNMPDTKTGIFELLKTFENNTVLWIEEQAVRGGEPRDHIRGLNVLLENYHTILAFAELLKIPIIKLDPKIWQKKFRPLPKAYAERKKALADFAREKYPRLKPTAKNADAILILEHARIMM